MPQLPSYRHVAIDPYRLAASLDDADNPANIHEILAVDSPSEMTNLAAGMWQLLSGHYPFLLQPFGPEISVRDVARAWREAGHLAHLPADKQEWLHNQMVAECANLWNIAGPLLERCCPGAYAVITLVTISPEGAKWR